MLKEPVPSEEKGSPLAKLKLSCFWKFMIPLCLATLFGIIITVILLHRSPWLIPTPNVQEINILKNQTASLDNRLSQLEGMENASQELSINPEQIKVFEARINSLQQQIEAVLNRPKAVESPQLLERSQAFEKDLNRLAENQQTLKSAFLLLRLRLKVMSDGPYAAELADFKSTLKETGDLSILDKYADQGLQVLNPPREDSLLPLNEDEHASWWSRMKRIFSSFIKVEKVDAPLPVSSSSMEDRKSIEDLLTQLDQILSQKLETTPVTLSPLPGDAL